MTGSKAAKPPFHGLELDDMDQRLEAQAASKGIPTLVSPKAQPAPVELTPPALASAPKAQAQSPERPAARPSETAATPREKMKTINFEVPPYAWVAIKTAAANEMVSVRHFLMEAVRAKGIDIREEDMVEDGRRLRGAAAVKDL